jgi:quercetin dioxygenase-like cupin family protein
MGARVTPADPHAGGPGEAESRLRAEGLQPRSWSNAPGDTYGWHRHGYHKVLYCLSGSIVFHTREDGDLELAPGDRLDVEPGTDHAATVGPEGVRCVEAPRG